MDKTACVSGCGDNQTEGAIQDYANSKQCMCGPGYSLLSDEKSCGCPLLGPNDKVCVDSCGEFTHNVLISSYPQVEQCRCDPGFDPGDTNYCLCYNKLSHYGKHCITKCNPGQVLNGQQCLCSNGFTPIDEGLHCECSGHLSYDGDSCVQSCGDNSALVPVTDSDVMQCSCISGFTLTEGHDSCECKDYLSPDKKQCLAECQTNQTKVDNFCRCVDGMYYDSAKQICVDTCDQTSADGVCKTCAEVAADVEDEGEKLPFWDSQAK